MGVVLGLLAQGVSLGFTAAVSPGPFLIYIITQTLARGWRYSLPIIFAPLLSDGPVIILTLFVLGQLPDWALRSIQIVGGLFILYLAWGMARQLRQNKSINLMSGETPQAQNALLRGVVINFFSPGLWIFWSTVNGPIVINAWRDSPAAALAFVLGFYVLLIGGAAVWIAVFHQARRLDERIVRTLMAASVVIMAVFGGLLLKAGLIG